MEAMPASERDRIVAWLNLQQAYRAIETLLEERLNAEVGLSWAEFQVLFRLMIAGDRPLRMSEIAGQLLASPSGVTRIADRLERLGLISRQTPPENRRVVRVLLSERGREVLAAADRVFTDVLGRSFSGQLSAEDVASLRRILRKVLEASGAWDVARCEPGALAGGAGEVAGARLEHHA